MATNPKIVINAQDNASGVLAKISGNVSSLGSVASRIGASMAAVGLGVGALVAMSKSAIDGIDALNDLSDATGSTVENISALEDVAKRTGTSMDTVATAMVKFNGVLKDAKPGSDAAAALQAIGLSAKELKALDPAEALLKTASALSGFADDGNKARIVQELFGKSLKDVAPLLKDLAEKGKLVPTVTSEMAKEAEKFNQELFAMRKNIEDLTREIAGPLVKAFNSFIEKQRQAKQEGKFGLFTSLEDMGKAAERKKSANFEGSWYTGNAGRGSVNPAAVLPSLPDTLGTGSGPKGGTGKTQAQKDAEDQAKRRMDMQRQNAMDAGDAVTRENQQLADAEIQRKKDTAAEILKIQRQLVLDEYDARVKAQDDENKAIEDALKERARTEKEFSDTLHNDLKSAFSSAFRDSSGEPLQAFGNAIANVIYSRASTAMAETLIGSMGGTGGGSFLSSLFSFEGGGFTGSGARSGGLDGKGGFMAMVHPNETVLDHTKGQGTTSAQPITVVQNFTVGDVASVSMVRQAVAGSERRIAGAMGRSMQYGGALS